MASSGVSAVHNPASNLKLGSGIAPVVELKSRGVNVALGTDGGDTSDSYSVFEQMRLAVFLSRLTVADPENWLTALDALRMGTMNGAQWFWEGRTSTSARRRQEMCLLPRVLAKEGFYNARTTLDPCHPLSA